MAGKDRNWFQRPWLVHVLLLGIWTLLGLFDAGQTLFYYRLLDRPVPADLVILRGLAEWYIWAMLAPLILDVARWTPFGPGRWAANFSVQMALMGLFALVRVVLDVPVAKVLREEFHPQRTALEWFQIFLALKYFPHLIVCCFILGLGHALTYYHKYRDREIRTSQLEAQLAQAQLQVLKMQLHPHFLFNTLHAISSLMHKDLDLADRMIARLGELLRSSLENSGRQEVSLRQELDFVKPYLEIEQARLGPRLQVEMDIEPDVLDALVPNLILQPLIENAIRHGISVREKGGHIRVSARHEGDMLSLAVADDGPGLPATQPAERPGGIGLANTRARLERLYEKSHRFELKSIPGKGLTVILAIPFREDAGTTEDAGPAEASRAFQRLPVGSA
jgi:signal transduction histidine kinase